MSMKKNLFYGLLWNCLFVHKLSLRTFIVIFPWPKLCTTTILPTTYVTFYQFLSYNYNSWWFCLSRLIVCFWSCLCLSYFHINVKEVSFLHTVWTCLPYQSLLILTLPSVPLSFYHFLNKSRNVRKYNLMPIVRCKNHM